MPRDWDVYHSSTPATERDLAPRRLTKSLGSQQSPSPPRLSASQFYVQPHVRPIIRRVFYAGAAHRILMSHGMLGVSTELPATLLSKLLGQAR